MDLEAYLQSESQGHARVIPRANRPLGFHRAYPEKVQTGSLFPWIMELFGEGCSFDVLISILTYTWEEFKSLPLLYKASKVVSNYVLTTADRGL